VNHDEIQELLGAYAVDAVDADEATEIEAHLDDCARCRAEVTELRETAAMLAHSGGDAPTGLWDRIAASLGDSPPPIELDMHRRRRRGSVLRVVAAVAAAVLIVLLSASVVSLRRDVDNLHDKTAAAADPIALAAGQALTNPSSKLARLTGTGGTSAVTVVGADGQAYLLGDSLPPAAGKLYELWGQRAPGEVVALGTVPGPGVYAFAADPSLQAILVTAEDRPVSAPTSAPIMSGTLA
jgi:hypothetical protein